jgi:hypothetical protein
MVEASLIKEIIALYRKHGWDLRRVLLSDNGRGDLKDHLAELFGDAEIAEFEKDAAWFSRRSGDEGEAWEIRLLAETPYALIDVFGPDQDEAQREEIRCDMERRLLDAQPKKIQVQST